MGRPTDWHVLDLDQDPTPGDPTQVETLARRLRDFSAPVRNSEVRNWTTHGVMFLTLAPTGYDWRFTPIPGQSFTDSGSGACH